MKLPDIDLCPFERTWLSWILNPEEEKILWAGRPKSLAWHDGTVAVLLGIPFWIPVAYIVFTDTTANLGADSPWYYYFVRALSILITAEFILFLLWKQFKARHTVYVLTKQRAIIQSPRLLGRPRYQIYPLHAEMIRDRYVNKQGVGSFVFGHDIIFLGLHHLIGWPIGFLNIPDFEKVNTLLLDELFYRHGLTPDIMPDRSRRSLSGSAAVQFIIGSLFILTGAATWFSSTTLPHGWVEQRVHITYAHANRTPGGDGAFLMQTADGTVYRVPLAGSRDKHQEGDCISIVYPDGNPLQARLSATTPSYRFIARGLIILGLLLIAHSIIHHLILRNKNYGTT